MYHSEQILTAVGELSDDKVEKAGLALGYAGPAKRAAQPQLRKFAALAAAAVLLLALGITAYAVNFLGVRAMFRSAAVTLPEAAGKWIEEQNAVAVGDGWSAQVTESLCDASTVMLTVTIDGGERYIVAPTDASPQDPLWVIGRSEDMTLGEYAEAQGKTLLFAGVSLPWEELGLIGQGQRTENLSDSEMNLLLVASKTVSMPVLETSCTVYVLPDGGTEVERAEIPITLTEGDSQDLGRFEPLTPDAIPGITLGSAHALATPLGLTVEVSLNVTDEEAFRDFLKIDFAEIKSYRDGAMILQEDGLYLARITMAEGVVTDTLTARFYNCDKELIGTVTFRK